MLITNLEGGRLELNTQRMAYIWIDGSFTQVFYYELARKVHLNHLATAIQTLKH